MINYLQPGDPRLAGREKFLRASDSAKAEIRTIQDAPTSIAETRTKVKAAIDAKLAQISENPFGLFQGTGEVLGWAKLPDLDFGLYLRLEGPENVLKKIIATIEAAGRPVGLPAAERETRIAELKLQARAAEIGAEREALRLEGAGFSVLRRPDADLDLLLEVWGESTAPAAAAQPAAAAA